MGRRGDRGLISGGPRRREDSRNVWAAGDAASICSWLFPLFQRIGLGRGCQCGIFRERSWSAMETNEKRRTVMSRKSRRNRAVEAAKAQHPSAGRKANERVNVDLLMPVFDECGEVSVPRGRASCSGAQFDMAAIMRKPVVDPFARKGAC